MNRNNIRLLTEDQLTTWTNASKSIPRAQLDELITQIFLIPANSRQTEEFYEIRRQDAPLAFDSLLKLQNTEAVNRHIETSQGEFREVLRVEVTLLDGIMLILGILLDFILETLSPNANGAGSPPSTTLPLKALSPENKVYIPTWKRQAQRITHDEPSL